MLSSIFPGPAAPAAGAPSIQAAWGRRRWVEIGLIFGFWTLLALLMATSDLLEPRGDALPQLRLRVVLRSFLRFYLWALLTPFIFSLSRRFPLSRAHAARHALLHLALAFIFAFAVDAVDDVLRIYLTRPPAERPAVFNPFEDLFVLGFLSELMVYLAILAAGFARDYFLRLGAREREAVQLQAQTATLEQQLAEARLSALRMQINPHFLFNTLHGIATLVERDPKGVRRMIALLSRLLRHALDETDALEVPMRREMDFLNSYLDIMQIRFQGRLEVRREVEEDLMEALVPHLILQPLVENAIKHGVSQSGSGGRLTLRVQRDGDRLVLSVRDNGPRFGGGRTEGDGAPEAAALALEEGTGLSNVRARLEALYGGEGTLTFRAAPGGGLVAQVALPYHTRVDLHAVLVADDSE